MGLSTTILLLERLTFVDDTHIGSLPASIKNYSTVGMNMVWGNTNLTNPDVCLSTNWILFHSGKKPRTKAPRIQRLVTPRVLQHKRRRIALKRQRTQKNKEEASEYAKLLAKRMKVMGLSSPLCLATKN